MFTVDSNEELNIKALKLVTITENRKKTTFKVDSVEIGKDFLFIAGPCSVESEEQIMESAKLAFEAGANMLRGGAYKLRTSPYSFQGLGKVGLEYLSKAGRFYKMPIVTEIIDTRDVSLVSEYADILQIGARNMQNITLLTEVSKTNKPVLLKRGMNATLEEWLNSAEYILKGGNNKVILCERGIRTFETFTRNTLDLSSVTALKELTHLPVIVDPSHATGRRELVEPMSLAAIIAGCDGLEVEMHYNPKVALSDAEQQLSGKQLKDLIINAKKTIDFRNTLNLALEE